MTKSVVAIVANVKRFRLPFYGQLAEALRSEGIDFKVVYSDPDYSERLKQDSIDLPGSIGLKVKGVYLFGGRALLQLPPVQKLASADLIIVVQANGYLLNYLLLPLTWCGLKRIAFWGHAFNHQSHSTSIRERFKRVLATKVNWWFTYTRNTERYLQQLGFPCNRITVIENAIDTSTFSRQVTAVSPDESFALRHRLGFPKNAIVGIYCGSLYADKQLDFLIRVGDRLHNLHDRFRMIVIGDGPEREKMREAADSKGWLRYCGPQFGSDKAAFFAASNFFFHPGAVGLAILDSFAAGIPFITSDYQGHGPEFSYLENEVNGLMLPFESDAFAAGTSRLISDPDLLASLSRGARLSGARYTLENMVSNVAGGVMACLAGGELLPNERDSL